LDPTTRRATTPQGQEYTLTDTVGFVRHLPHQLVEAFRSTLEETADADLLLHVVDGADPMPERQVEAVREVLAEITEGRKTPMPPELVVVNKIDDADQLVLSRLRHVLPNASFVSARTGAGITGLVQRIADALPQPQVEVDALLPWTEGALVARVHAEGEMLATDHTEDGTRLRARVRPDLAGALTGYLVKP
jgi:GTPase